MRTKTMILVCVILLWFLLVPGLVLARGQYEENSMSGLSCVDCHSSTSPKYPLLGAAEGYEHSGHDRGFENEERNSYYANGAGCQRCHTNEGFIEYVETGSVDSEAFVEYPSQPGCFSCHMWDHSSTGLTGLSTDDWPGGFDNASSLPPPIKIWIHGQNRKWVINFMCNSYPEFTKNLN